MDIRFRVRFTQAGAEYRCILTSQGKQRRSRWKATRMAAVADAYFWRDFYRGA